MEGPASAKARCLAYVEQCFREQLALPEGPDVALLSIVLGALEQPLSRKGAEAWPEDLPATVAQHRAAWLAWLAAAHGWLPGAGGAAAKVKAIADAVWGKLQKGFSKDILHAQHVHSFTSLLLPAPADTSAGKAPRRQLDCAGVVSTTYAACAHLARLGHEDLGDARMQISEDHCWIHLGTPGGGAAERGATVEVTTDTAAKRGLPVDPEAWRGWLYCGGGATLCTPRQAVAALVASVDPTITKGKKGSDSEHLQEVQGRLLGMLRREHPDALYPAALCTLADLREVEQQDALDAALGAGSLDALLPLLERTPDDPQALFEAAIAAAASPSAGREPDSTAPPDGEAEAEAEAVPAAGSSCWYPYSYLAAYLGRRADFLSGRCAAAFPDAAPALRQRAVAAVREALLWCGRGGAVLSRYAYRPQTDEELYKDVEGVLEGVLDGLRDHSKHLPGGAAAGGIEDASLLVPVLQLWDGVCCLFAGKPKPTGWVTTLLRVAGLFSPAAREQAAAQAVVASEPMLKARPLWAALKPAVVKPIFETADVAAAGGDRQAKKRRL